MESIIKRSFNSPDEVKKPFPKGTIKTVNIGGLVIISRETLEPG